MAITYRTYRNLESSLKDHIKTVLDANFSSPKVNVSVGKRFDDTWKLPIVVVYWNNAPITPLGIGEKRWIETNTMIIDIFAKDEGFKLDITSVLIQGFREGFDCHTLAKDPSDQSKVIKTPNGSAHVSILSNDPVDLGDNAPKMDKFRQRITLTVDTVEL